jgi:hypothetical protein
MSLSLKGCCKSADFSVRGKRVATLAPADGPGVEWSLAAVAGRAKHQSTHIRVGGRRTRIIITRLWLRLSFRLSRL